jgi:heptosyltransferase-3
LKAAVVCASGIGDALLMQIAARHLRALGFTVTTFSKHLGELAGWFPCFSFAPYAEKSLAEFDLVVLQHDNTPKAKQVHALDKPVYTFYGQYTISKHGRLREGYDVVFDQSLCMAENISLAMQKLFPGPEEDLWNGLTPPPHLQFNRYPNRVVLHPTSASPAKNWPRASFLKLHSELERAGWDPVFITSASEATLWNSPLFPTLSDLAAFIYESAFHIGNDSGPGHLASNLGLPTLIIGPNKQHLTFWRPGWCRGEIIYPPSWVGKMKLTRESWMHFISASSVFKRFKKLSDIK